ncbi:hypothetical protein [Mesorhizobium neociceri]|uniref:Uncharacterized protein n=1 Tax=Mesorhizobium neociceri TaxID=1307853 RepID=A0A838B771_9HYPH|nr:hypothetical protein [Mesorhizobium neociceri]MBA1142466.1 hypothetical protein [Mesorhizobium neociceri]
MTAISSCAPFQTVHEYAVARTLDGTSLVVKVVVAHGAMSSVIERPPQGNFPPLEANLQAVAACKVAQVKLINRETTGRRAQWFLIVLTPNVLCGGYRDGMKPCAVTGVQPISRTDLLRNVHRRNTVNASGSDTPWPSRQKLHRAGASGLLTIVHIGCGLQFQIAQSHACVRIRRAAATMI